MSDRMIRYKEIIPLGKIYNLVSVGVGFLLLLLTIIFIATKILAGAISTGLTLIFIVVMTVTLQALKLFVTDDEFIVKYWFLTFRVNLFDIEAVEIKDVSLLPEPYQAHIKVYWGVESFNGLRVFKLRKGDAVHIRTKRGQTIIITPKNNQRLADVLKEKIK